MKKIIKYTKSGYEYWILNPSKPEVQEIHLPDMMG